MLAKAVWQVDVFTTQRFCGNPAAVVFDGEGLSPRAMQAVAREMNLSETVFVFPPSSAAADYRVRIFTPRRELAFAGHPTLAAAYALVTRGDLSAAAGAGLLRQECGIGVIPVEVAPGEGGPSFVMTQGKPEYRGVDVGRAASALLLGCGAADVLDCPVEVVSTGLPWLVIPIRSRGPMARLSPDLALIERVCRDRVAVGVTAFCLGAADPSCRVRVRTFAPGDGVAEDPVCGSGNGSVAAYLAKHGLMGSEDLSYYAEQGVEISRPGKVFVRCTRDGTGGGLKVRVGGQAVKVLEGTLMI
jgi:PhzF family phenazine biosynthesis protein